ncbi:MAG: hypothetical protein ACXVXT_19975 [Blastococcus sp.]
MAQETWTGTPDPMNTRTTLSTPRNHRTRTRTAVSASLPREHRFAALCASSR